ncbi:MAG: sodium:solute symporter [Bacteroidia bacterium]|nr:MAG: sodium:solute symporter [Bacteroidia bacterium]
MLAYVGLLWAIGYAVARRSRGGLDTFYTAERKAHWFWVSYSMVGTALSGLTFLSLPGSTKTDGWTYLQVVVGYLFGYLATAFVLLPLYYHHAKASVYEYFRYRLGAAAEKTATLLFLISRGVGSSLRLFLALWVLKAFWPEVPFPWLSAIALALILSYSLHSGVAALIYTDFLQTTVFVGAAGYTAYFLLSQGAFACAVPPSILDTHPSSPHFWVKDVLSGALIAFTMTGLDQDQMQKNLSLPTLRHAQKNLLLYAFWLFPVNILFLGLGSLLWGYVDCHAIPVSAPDELYLQVVRHLDSPLLTGLFIVGLTASSFSSADGTLTALTTVTLRNLLPARYETPQAKNLLMAMWALVFWGLLWAYTWIPREGHLLGFFLKLSGYLYGPLLGLFLFSRLETRPNPLHRRIPWALMGSLILAVATEEVLPFSLGYARIAWIGGMTAAGLWIATRAFRLPRRAAVSKPERTSKSAPD